MLILACYRRKWIADLERLRISGKAGQREAQEEQRKDRRKDTKRFHDLVWLAGMKRR